MTAAPSTTDPQTKTARRDHFLRRLRSESEAARRDGVPLSLLMVCVDGLLRLQAVGDQAVVDKVLHQTARLVEGALRSRDFVARYTDDTFAVILPDTSADVAGAIGSKLLRLVRSSELGDIDRPVSVTLSAGLSNRSTDSRTSSFELVNQALDNLDKARMTGGNRLVGGGHRARAQCAIEPPPPA